MSNALDSSLNLKFIGQAHTPYNEKFAIPRQPGLVKDAHGYIELYDKCHANQMVEGLEQYSHLWVLFAFHATADKGWKAMVRPPRLGGNKKLGVLATRSTFRPNPIGMSVVKLEDISTVNGTTRINISGMDLLNGTPIIDIKPYIPYADAIVDATSSIAQHAGKTIAVCFNPQSEKLLAQLANKYPRLKTMISQVLSQDPRPAYKRNSKDDKVYGMSLYNLNINWHMLDATTAQVTVIEQRKDEN
ncbi:tRNA (N6-threonylcarbamoyladenosine(37)-N6)-methyltransferase TrmO [Thalassotalea sp. LPB0316]|uniref:tRNA (N6-threonylcarbamoyladenosine(37)-N6)-methyltransferase TrmO n=1 Tax=Thalassotalea sp. LPB0316 TaxID=2769490 RepID=UPI0018673D85|nr:tRNA (N6-threonylcarbamoyladenosine(37)-N6)-methyltransferase TrmO [Thalassotalea sp. LPB0316]QOL24745.1 tRNA (N6-threonylcarbamoyladenosine(37)-N6)-methyltransferase TrmO [Thalassotalea sp. LPB0316]